MTAVWIELGLLAPTIGVSGYFLCLYGDVIAEKTGLGRAWIGLVLVASVTSLPELITGASAVILAHAPDIAIGDALGSCVFNLLLIVFLDFLHRGESVYTRASQGHLLSAGFGIILIGFVGLNILLGDSQLHFALGHVGVYAPVIAVLYLIAMRTVFRYERREVSHFVGKVVAQYPSVSLRAAVLRYVLAGLVVVAAGSLLPFVAKDLAQVMGWHQSFVGTLFVAAVTSLPEMAVTLAALRLGALDLAIANLFGSNLFNTIIVAIDDLLFFRGPILSYVTPVHAASAFTGVMMTGVAIVGLLYRPRTRLFNTIGWVSLFLFTLYLLNAYVIFIYEK